MADRLYLSCWPRGFNESSMLRQFAKLLEVFPFSKLAQRGPALRIYAVEHTEPPQVEREFAKDVEPAAIVAAAREFAHADSCFELGAAWDLWRSNPEWKLEPAPVTLLCLGPEFDNELGDCLRIEFGPDAEFLPNAKVEGSLRMGQSNLRSLLRLVSDIEKALPMEKRTLWSESGMNFADLLAETISRYGVN